jgi:hypothetical protein
MLAVVSGVMKESLKAANSVHKKVALPVAMRVVRKIDMLAEMIVVSIFE